MTRDQHIYPPIRFSVACSAWAIGFLAANMLAAVVLGVAGFDPDEPLTATIFTVQVAVLWPVMLASVIIAGRVGGSGDLRRDLGLRFAPLDALGVVAGAVAQLVVLPVVYWPLRQLWPETFSTGELERRANELIDSGTGVWLVMIGVCIVLGAPLVEEIVYRSMLQRSATTVLGRVGAWVGVSLLFAVIHFSWIEIPGLFMAGLLFGVGIWRFDRVGFGIAAHVGFNAVAFVGALYT